jgi:hypothetical protein
VKQRVKILLIVWRRQALPKKKPAVVKHLDRKLDEYLSDHPGCEVSREIMIDAFKAGVKAADSYIIKILPKVGMEAK